MINYLLGLFGYVIVTIESQTVAPVKEPKKYRQTPAALAARSDEQVEFEHWAGHQSFLKDRSRRWYITEYDDVIMSWCLQAFTAGLECQDN